MGSIGFVIRINNQWTLERRGGRERRSWGDCFLWSTRLFIEAILERGGSSCRLFLSALYGFLPSKCCSPSPDIVYIRQTRKAKTPTQRRHCPHLPPLKSSPSPRSCHPESVWARFILRTPLSQCLSILVIPPYGKRV